MWCAMHSKKVSKGICIWKRSARVYAFEKGQQGYRLSKKVSKGRQVGRKQCPHCLVRGWQCVAGAKLMCLFYNICHRNLFLSWERVCKLRGRCKWQVLRNPSHFTLSTLLRVCSEAAKRENIEGWQKRTRPKRNDHRFDRFEHMAKTWWAWRHLKLLRIQAGLCFYQRGDWFVNACVVLPFFIIALYVH